MKNIYLGLLLISLLLIGCRTAETIKSKENITLVNEILINKTAMDVGIKLPEPSYESETSIEEAIKERRSVREYSEKALSLDDLSQLLWAAQGITEGEKRTAPSAGALYPLELYVVAGNVEGIEAGVYHYNPEKHSLTKTKDTDLRAELAVAAMAQTWIKDAPAIIVFTAVYERTASKYGERGERYVHMEAGHASQNVCLQAESLGMGTVTVGAFSDSTVKILLGIDEDPLYIMPIGYKKAQ